MMDVVIIGSGYAGSLLASLLENFDVVVFDKDKKRKNKSVTTFREIVSEEAIKNTYSKLTFMNTRGTSVEYDFGEDLFAFVDYQKLCESLWKDVEVKKVISYNNDEVILENGERIKAKVIVDCSGMDGEDLRVGAGIETPPRLIYISYERLKELNVPEDTFYLIVGCSLYGGWIYPARESEVGAANLFRRNARAEYPSVSVLKNSYPEMFSNCVVGKQFKEVYPYGFVKRAVHGSIVLFGDSAGLTHPMYATSIHYIHFASKPLAEAVKNYLKGFGKLENYQKWWRGFLKGIRLLTAKSFAHWELPIKEQEKLVELHKRAEVHPESIISELKGLKDEPIYAKNPPKIWEMPIKLLLKTAYYYLRLSF